MRMLQTNSCHQFRINRRAQPSEPSWGESGLWPPNRQKTWLLNATWSHKWKTKRLSRNFSWNLSRCRFSRNFSLFTQQFCKLNCYAQKFKQVPMGRETIALVSSSRGLGSGFVVALASSETPTKRTNDNMIGPTKNALHHMPQQHRQLSLMMMLRLDPDNDCERSATSKYLEPQPCIQAICQKTCGFSLDKEYSPKPHVQTTFSSAVRTIYA